MTLSTSSRRPVADAGALRADRSPQRPPVTASPVAGGPGDVASTAGPRRASRAAGTERDGYLDVLRTAALLQVFALRFSDAAWLPIIFPSTGLLFAIGGSLMASSLDRSPGRAGKVLRQRLRRLLPPLWMLGLVVIPLMVATGWQTTLEGTRAPGPSLLSWILPLTHPPDSDAGADTTAVLWFLRTYLWLMLMSPALLWLSRHWPRIMYLLPLVVLLLVDGSLIQLEGDVGESVLSVVTFVACWMLGFAHHDGSLRRVRMWKILAGGLLLCAAGVAWAVRYPVGNAALPNVSDIPVAEALFNLGFTMILLRLPTRLAVVERRPLLRAVFTGIDRRLLTMYLWSSIAMDLAMAALRRHLIPPPLVEGPWSPFVPVGVTLVVLAGFVVTLGWVEDIAMRRRPQVWPTSGRASRPRAYPRRAIAERG
ncbi:acyltransferase family protein [Raineyella fluvialis]|uniref:Acyltransferase family protein n=1 Tax=Raineyella fluvialis TaxID=2662261 RepID=A0A5Q2FHE9_9ACTN|nr:acyltransferase [Raineyella fluvialis]QGF24974.1 acyltransferase family protein [Raineyella fluvialis]